jgi:hypothetical protein
MCKDMKDSSSQGGQVSKSVPAVALEFWPYGLNRANSIEKLMTTISHFEGYYDLIEGISKSSAFKRSI